MYDKSTIALKLLKLNLFTLRLSVPKLSVIGVESVRVT